MEHLSMGVVRRTWRVGFFAGDAVGYESKALETGISLHGGSAGQTVVGSTTGDIERWLKGALEMERSSLYESYVKGSWREGSLSGTLKVEVSGNGHHTC
jgi:hypothetical protein